MDTNLVVDLLTLGVKMGRKYSLADVKASYKAEIRRHHPDLGGSEERTKEINAAFDRAMPVLERRLPEGKTFFLRERVPQPPRRNFLADAVYSIDYQRIVREAFRQANEERRRASTRGGPIRGRRASHIIVDDPFG